MTTRGRRRARHPGSVRRSSRRLSGSGPCRCRPVCISNAVDGYHAKNINTCHRWQHAGGKPDTDTQSRSPRGKQCSETHPPHGRCAVS